MTHYFVQLRRVLCHYQHHLAVAVAVLVELHQEHHSVGYQDFQLVVSRQGVRLVVNCQGLRLVVNCLEVQLVAYHCLHLPRVVVVADHRHHYHLVDQQQRW